VTIIVIAITSIIAIATISATFFLVALFAAALAGCATRLRPEWMPAIQSAFAMPSGKDAVLFGVNVF
jgi:hypothetical protein